MQKKILITFLFKEGAGPVFTLEMSRGLAQNGCEIHALLSSKISNRKDWENEKYTRYFLLKYPTERIGKMRNHSKV